MRYTEYHAGKAVIKDRKPLPGAMEKLAAYENTGLTPEKITELKERVNGGWIPVEERLPEVDADIEETIEDDDCPEYNVTIRGASESTTLKYSPDGAWFDANGYIYDVIAWQPLPEPYHPESETEKPNWRRNMLRKFDRRSRQ